MRRPYLDLHCLPSNLITQDDIACTKHFLKFCTCKLCCLLFGTIMVKRWRVPIHTVIMIHLNTINARFQLEILSVVKNEYE